MIKDMLASIAAFVGKSPRQVVPTALHDIAFQVSLTEAIFIALNPNAEKWMRENYPDNVDNKATRETGGLSLTFKIPQEGAAAKLFRVAAQQRGFYADWDFLDKE